MSSEEIFMAYDVRGRGIDTHEAFLFGRALGSVLNGSCFVGYDCRESSPSLAQHVIEGLRSSGINVVIGGFMPGPVCYFKVFNNFDFGVYVTASHLPKEYNGFKVMLRDGTGISPEDLLKVRDLFHNFKFVKENLRPAIQDITSINDYVNFMLKEFGTNDIKCVIDCFNASTGVLSERLFKRALKARVINDNPLPDFGGKHPEPSDKNLQEVQEEVVKTKSAFGAGLDGDGDRAVFVDETGRIISGNLMTMLFSKYFLTKKKGNIVAPVSVSNILEKVVNPLGGSVKWCLVGHTFIEKEIVKTKALFGGEESNHFYFNTYYPFSDGILSILILARILKESGKKFSALINELPSLHVSKEEIEFPTHKAKEEAAAKIISDLYKRHPKANTLDGVKFEDEGAFILVRPSQTRHTVKVFVEAETKELMNTKLSEYVRIIEQYK